MSTYQFPSKRNVHYAKSAMVATSTPLAAQAGLDIIKKGGNAIDAAIATAAMLTVVEPTSNGIGGDAFALIWTSGKLHGINGSGPAPHRISAEAIQGAGHEKMPIFGMIPITVPGLPATWAALSERFGKLPLEVVLKPAIDAARDGFAVTETVAKYWEKAFQKYSEIFKEPVYDEWFKVFAPNGNAPKAGEIWRSEAHAQTLEELAQTNCRSFYEGRIAAKIAHLSNANGGYIDVSDLRTYKPEWVEPIACDYRGYQVCEIPPNGQGISALMALNMLNQFDLKDFYEPHLLIEATKLAMVDANAYVADSNHMTFDYNRMLSSVYAESRAKLIGKQALQPESGQPQSGGTVYLCTADVEGNMVSYIQSNYMGFGSGVVVPGTGIALHNRGNNFTLEKGHPNCIAGGKRPFHTIIPGFLMKDGAAIGPFGVMGGFMQPQGHVQVVTNTIDYHMNPQSALDAPRWQWMKDKHITVEPNFPESVITDLRARGHVVKVDEEIGSFGRGQIIWRTKEGTYVGGTESRCDGHIASL
ncbi:MAG TPA: gamma-glutamyltransferase [Clostridiales bacterium UBA8960]|nr:gamma-glutamyltransferase [Clostridiales bacterium UBA8960]